jgi:hypothetical protein
MDSKESIVNFDRAYNKLFKEYKNMIDLGAYKNIGAEDIVQEGVISFLEKNRDLSVFENQKHLVATMAMFIKNRRRSLTHNVNLRTYKSSKHLSFTDDLNNNYFDEPTIIDSIDLDSTVYAKLYCKGYNSTEVGKMTGVSHMTVLRHLKKEVKKIV